MKKTEFYNDIKTNVRYLTGLKREYWYKVGGSIALENDFYCIDIKCNRNVVTLSTKGIGEKGETVVIDYNKGYKENMVTLTAEKVYNFLTFKKRGF